MLQIVGNVYCWAFVDHCVFAGSSFAAGGNSHARRFQSLDYRHAYACKRKQEIQQSRNPHKSVKSRSPTIASWVTGCDFQSVFLDLDNLQTARAFQCADCL